MYSIQLACTPTLCSIPCPISSSWGNSTCFFFFHFRLPTTSLLSPFNIFSTTNPPPSTPSTTALKTRPKASRRVYILYLTPLASYSTCLACFFALVDWALEKFLSPVQLALNHFNPRKNINFCLAQPYFIPYLGPWAPVWTFDIRPLGLSHTLARGAVSLPPSRKNGRLTVSIPLLQKLIWSRFFSSENLCNIPLYLHTLRTTPRSVWLGPVGLDVADSHFKVWSIDETGEVFTSYEEYLKRLAHMLASCPLLRTNYRDT